MSDAADRLAKTRLAIIEQIQRREGRPQRRGATDFERDDLHGGEGWEASGSGPASWFATLKRAASSWWRQHPAHYGLELATPALSEYAGRKPVQFLAIAAAVGAVAMIARPWRLISLGGIAMALLKSGQLSGLLMSAMSAADYPKERAPHR
jgi:hypothetical protein